MSSFRIYQVNHFDPAIAGQNVRRQVVFYIILIPVFELIFEFCIRVLKIGAELLCLTYLPLIIGIYIFLFYRLGLKLKRIKTIGEIEFTRTCFKKRLGDSATEYKFQTIKKIELIRHFPKVGISGSSSENFTYILKISFFRSSAESFIVSNSPTDTGLNISIVNTLKTLKKLSGLNIVIET